MINFYEPSLNTFAVQFVNEDSFTWYWKLTVLPAGSFHGFTVNPYVETYEIPARSSKWIEVTVPKTVMREWFSGFDGGVVDVTLEDVSDREYTYETIEKQFTLWGGHGYQNSLGLAMDYWNDTYMHGIAGYQTRFSAPNISNHNEITVAFKLRSLAGNKIKNVAAFTATYNLIETVGYSQLSKNNDDTYTCYVTFDNLFSPNIQFHIVVEYDEGIYAGPGVSAITDAIARINYTIPLQDYHDPVVYAEVKSPMDAQGKCTIAVTGRFQQQYMDSSGEYQANTPITGHCELLKSGSIDVIQRYDFTEQEIIIDGDVFATEVKFTGLDYQKVYKARFFFYDKIYEFGFASIEITNRIIFDWNHEDFNFNVPVYHQKDIYVREDASIHGIRPIDEYGSSETKTIFTPLDSTGNTVIGYDHYQQESGNTLIYGNSIDIIAHEGVTINGQPVFETVDQTATETAQAVATEAVAAFQNKFGKVLWEGSNAMGANTTITLNDKMSNQVSGIVLVFARNDINDPTIPVSWNSHFVSKDLIAGFDNTTVGQFGGGHVFLMANNAALSTFGAKYLSFYGEKEIRGHTSNTQSGTAASGLTFDNSGFYLKYVIGV